MDVACNRFIKFRAFREHALDRMGADLVATGEVHVHVSLFIVLPVAWGAARGDELFPGFWA